MKPLLYLNPVGTLLVEGDKVEPFLETSIAPYASTFMAWATKHFNVRWLTDIPPAHAFHLAEKLGLPGHEVPYVSFREAKSDGIEHGRHFFWADTHLTPSDVNWLTQYGKMDHFLAVNGTAGVTESHKTWLANKLNGKRK